MFVFHWNNEIHTICMLVVCNILVNTTQKNHGDLTVFDLRSYRSSWIMKFVAMDIWKFWYTYGWWFRNPTQPPGMYKTLLMGYTTSLILIYRPKRTNIAYEDMHFEVQTVSFQGNKKWCEYLDEDLDPLSRWSGQWSVWKRGGGRSFRGRWRWCLGMESWNPSATIFFGSFFGGFTFFKNDIWVVSFMFHFLEVS